MQTQQVHGVTGGGLLYTSKSTSVKSSETSFDQLMQMSQNVGRAEEKVPAPKGTTEKGSTAENVRKTEQPEQPVENSMAEDAGKLNEKTKMLKADGKDEISDQESAERAAGILNQVTEVVRDILNLTEEQLNAFMEQMGITAMDLLNPETLQNLVLMVNHEQDAVTLLTDAEMLATVKQLTEEVGKVLQEAGITPEELTMAMEQAAVQTDEAVNEEQVNAEDNITAAETEHADAANVTEKSTTIEFQTENNRDAHSEAGKDNKETMVETDQYANQFLQNLQKAAEQVSEVSGQKDVVQMIREIADQILEKVKVTLTPDTTSLEIVLTPEELGKVNLTITEQDGMMKARFVTENELAREAIESNLVQFKEMLNEQGIKVESIEVMVSNFEFDKNGQAGQNAQEEKKNGKRNFVAEDGVSQVQETDQIAQHFMEGGESTVNYMA